MSFFSNYNSKEYSSVVPNDPIASSYSSAEFERDPIDRYGQIDAITSTSEVVQNMIPHVYDLYNSYGLKLGGCITISVNLVLMPAHIIQGYEANIDQLSIKNRDEEATLIHIIELNYNLDYAIIQVKEPILQQSYPKLSCNIPYGELLLLHSPNNKQLQVSSHISNYQTQFEQIEVETYHDTDHGSSGGPYINPHSGEIIAIHLASYSTAEKFSIPRKTLTMKQLGEQSPIIGGFLSETLQQNRIYFSETTAVHYRNSDDQFQLPCDEEGLLAQIDMTNRLTPYLGIDENIKLTQNKIASFSKENLDYIQKNYPAEYNACFNHCINRSGLHGSSKLYSMQCRIESDHLIPHAVWKMTSNSIMKSVVTNGSGGRAGENCMPAITIPYELHRKLATTGSSLETQNFHIKLRLLCDLNLIDEAIIECLEEYKKNGLLSGQYKIKQKKIETHLREYVHLKLIKESHIDEIIQTVYRQRVGLPQSEKATKKLKVFYDKQISKNGVQSISKKTAIEQINRFVVSHLINENQKNALLAYLNQKGIGP